MRASFLLLVLMFLMCSVSRVFAQERTYSNNPFISSSSSSFSTSRFDNPTTYVSTYFEHYRRGFQESFASNDALRWGFGGAITIGALSLLDNKGKEYFPKKKFLSDGISNFAYNFGGGPKTYITILGCLTGMATEYSVSDEQREEWLSKSELFLESVVTTSALTQIIKHLIYRTRPNSSDSYSFPSGHSSFSVSVAASLYEIYGWKVGVPASACAGVVIIQRMQVRAHYLSDVLSGALLGVLVTKGFAEIHNEEKNSTSSLQFFPNIYVAKDNIYAGIGVTF